ncbi:DNA-binding MarR family transcriptional regulator [Clostridium acetobutylicum]|uniref:Transcriptional regulator, MarR/EmrR family n=1 Tax=Clostridium acetobutylicum (strain ATCC 824 / DSM 792 / JCM 1419 / IAM 19013 / LMG 5710 / NBRC 13948 / NRRL B-527 / VKM B-1787 / 2291 / W) TaxID=272562 RepID=Q97D14_CLOAB|nr:MULTISPECIES: MarR family winged helix-turn-helix transcriptional regulator [Clostridium]AAK81590.1 Transcriptional regulator, MarR/EmrR family [Clostridium acetobutylicum ATCC 824]ADZ22713.1 Transcriptional regulator, MarR/EmrR family [Clostridium acetobutylicum EA 2018]AEI32982.1 MarR family transcriptional regulator [Clostridium acetobutylicum DSM 1731]AWV80735.1 MarR family transcriptional regulator [Clostridium acetobutylicum]KHD35460.1 MarR family transcriptional regulator [Clostridiu
MEIDLNNLVRLTNSLYRCNQVFLDKRLRELELTVGTYPYLLRLSHVEGISQNDISRELSVDKAMSARSIKKLIEIGYITKVENKDDIRAYKLYLTDKGREVIPKIFKVIGELLDILLEGSSQEEIETGIKFLEKVLNNAKENRKKCCERVKKA